VVNDSSIETERKKTSMIRVAISATIAVLLSCTTALADPPKYSLSDHPSQDGRCVGDTGVGDLDRSEPACLKQIGELAERVGPGLQLKFRNGLTRVYLNEDVKCQTPEAEGCVKYRLAGYFPEHDLLLIEVGYWEDGSWLLVRADSGKTSGSLRPRTTHLASTGSLPSLRASGRRDRLTELILSLPHSISLLRNGTTGARTMIHGFTSLQAGTATIA
jgi:hypothetical protein